MLLSAPRCLCAPLSLRLMLALISLFACLLPLPAHAGSYSGPLYAGGTYHGRGGPNGAEGDYNDTLGTSGWGGSGNSVASASAAGTISATFTWQPAQGQTAQTDPPPPSGSVIITETATAGAGVRTAPGGSCQATCDDGFGLPGSQQTQASAPQYSPPPNPVLTRYFAGASAQDTRYTLGGGATISLSVSPSATAGVSSSYSTNASVSYTASISPVTISLGGTTKDNSGGDNILVGQGCTAKINGIPSGDGWKTTYAWSVSGITFQKWNVTYVAGKSSSATLDTGLGLLTNPTAHWYWSDKAGSQTVSCTATVTPPAGQGSPFPVTAAQMVSLVLPTISVTPVPGRVQINNLAQSVYGPGYYLYAGPGINSQAGMTWTATITSPSLFTQDVTQNGTLWNFVQTTTPSRYRTPKGGSEQPSAVNGQSGLDTTYPYEPGPYSATFPGGYPASTVPSKSSDSPAAFISDGFQNYRVLDNFQTYIMYSPPGIDTQWVPVWEINWYWTANDAIPGSSWINWDNANDAGIVRAPNSESQTVHPKWTTLVLAPPAGVY